MLNPYREDISKLRVTSPYGMRGGVLHKGIDLVSDGDKTLVAIGDGGIITSTMVTDPNNITSEWGEYVRLDLDSGERVFYCHLRERLVNVGQRVRRGDSVGVEGNTGKSSASHLHLEIRPPGASTDAIDPAAFIGIENEVGRVTPIITEPPPEVDLEYERFKKKMVRYLAETAADETVSEWAVTARKWAMDNGISDGTMPQRFLKREEVLAMLYRIYLKGGILIVNMIEQIENNFVYHAPKEGQPEIYQKLRDKAKEFAYMINELVPDSREKSLAITHLEDVVMWANAGIARN